MFSVYVLWLDHYWDCFYIGAEQGRREPHRSGNFRSVYRFNWPLYDPTQGLTNSPIYASLVKIACHKLIYNNSMSMKKPSFGVIVGLAFLVLGSLRPMVDSKSIWGSIYVWGFSNVNTAVNLPVLILASLILIACIYNRSKIEISIITFLVFMIPFLVKANVQETIGNNRELHAIGGSYLIWIGSIIILASTLSAKNDDPS